ncbi:MAG: tyrosine-protein phosphatase [Acidimicrobiales bacterium]
MNRDPGLAGPSNFRDLGGYRSADGRTVRWGRVYRSDALRLTDDDVAVLRDRIGLRTIIDLRTAWEFGNLEGGGKAHYVQRLNQVGAERFHIPIVDETRMRRQVSEERPPGAKGYGKMLERGATALGEAFTLIANPELHPLVFHCAAGKDRTGILAALLLGILGVDDDTIIEDYALSQDNMARALEKIRARPDADAILANRPPAAFEAPTDAAIGFVEAVHQTHGGWSAAAATIGLDPAAIERLQNLLLE